MRSLISLFLGLFIIPLSAQNDKDATPLASPDQKIQTLVPHLGRHEQAFSYLKSALEKGFSDFNEMANDARWEALRGTEAFEAVMARFNRE